MKNGNKKGKIIMLIIGLVLIVSAVILLVFNEISPSTADAIKSAKELSDSNLTKLDGKAVWIKEKLNSVNRATDSEYIYVSDCVVLRRYVEVYKGYETSHYDSDGNFQYSTTDYQWEFRSLTYIVANDLKIGNYNIAKGLDMDFVDMPLLSLSGHVTNGHTLSNNLIYPKKNSGSANVPREYDIRVSYRFLKNEAEGIAIGKLSGNEIVTLDYGFPKVSVYKFFYNGSIDSIIKSFETTEQAVLWTLRVVGSLLTAAGISLIIFGYFKRKKVKI